MVVELVPQLNVLYGSRASTTAKLPFSNGAETLQYGEDDMS